MTTIPPAGPTGTSITLSGTGLAPSTAYIVLVPTPSQSAGLQIAGFNTTSNGLIPSSVTAIIPVIPTCTLPSGATYPACTSSASTPAIGELGSGIPINLFNTVTSSIDASGTFLLQARMTTNMTVAPTGHPIVVTATGLYAKSVYLVIFDADTMNGNTGGRPVGGLETTANGTSSGTFIVPNTSNNQRYVVQLYRTQFKLGTNYPFELANPPILVGGGVPSRCTISTSTLVPGIPSQSGRLTNGVEIQYTNTQACAVTAIVYAAVQEASTQAIYYTSSTITASAGQTVTAYLPIVGLSRHTYLMMIRAVTTSGSALSIGVQIDLTI